MNLQDRFDTIFQRAQDAARTGGVTAHIRAFGVQCYDIAGGVDLAHGDDLDEALEAPELAWFWESTRSGGATEDYEQYNLPRDRSLTAATGKNTAALARELQEIDEDGEQRYIILFGADLPFSAGLSDPAKLREALGTFVRGEESPLQIVLAQTPDVGSLLIWLPQRPSAVAMRLLADLKIDLRRPAVTRDYDPKDAYMLEAMYDL
ncbi:hypothetical protein CCAX7_002380 [Capsulimonas corticalis]|uniref:Uncharacterized protein n=1 Tax=Capsulimonas corticalis TaxID=2219043 RepID=A0A402CRX1_9BACT|nr:hypothetical protein [Capsulimonas corticalis]BDI28187.1 hypothetical protein CCAX7_002380 [Capsulimonas corticalis]